MGKVVYRVGGKIPRQRGARRECDPGAIPPDRFRDVINGRFVGLELASRGGQSRLTASPLDGCITGIFAAEYQDRPSAFYIADYAGSLPTVWVCTNSGATKVQASSPANRTLACSVVHAGRIYLGGLLDPGGTNDRSALWTLDPYAPTAGIVELVAPGGTGEWLQSLLSHTDGALYAGANGETFVTSVYKWDGTTMTVEDSIISVGHVRIAALGTDLLAAYTLSPSAAQVRRRTGGVWGGLSLPAGIGAFNFDDILTFNGAVYFCGVATVSAPYPVGVSAVIMKWDGNSLTVPWIKHPIDFAGASLYVTGMAEHDGTMYFTWIVDAAGVETVRIGSQSSGGSWTDEVKNITSQFPDLSVYQNKVFGFESLFYLHCFDSVAGRGKLVRAPLANLGGTWEDVTTAFLGTLLGNEAAPNTMRPAVL